MRDVLEALNRTQQRLGASASMVEHTGSAVDGPDEVYAVMEKIDSRVFKFAPDTGQLQKGGGDAAKIVSDFKSIVAHMHLKDYSGWEHFQGYTPLGEEKVDLKSILATMEAANPNANIMHELDGSGKAPYTPRETAERSKKYLQTLGYQFLRWIESSSCWEAPAGSNEIPRRGIGHTVAVMLAAASRCLLVSSGDELIRFRCSCHKASRLPHCAPPATP